MKLYITSAYVNAHRGALREAS